MSLSGTYRFDRLSRAAVGAAVFFGAAVFAFTGRAYSSTAVSWGEVYLDTSGTASWSADFDDSEAVDKYELKLARQHNGSWNTSYKTPKTTDTSYDFNFTSTGKYYFTVRIKFVGGGYSDWSPKSNEVAISSDDVSPGGSSGSSGTYITTQVSGGTYVTQTYGPGATGVNTYYASYGPGYTNTTGTVTNTSGTTGSGWVRDGSKWRYLYANGTSPSNTWDYINNEWYYFDSDGTMHVGWLYYNNNWYYCLQDGRRATGWNNVNEKWYYLDESGIMQTGYIEVNGIQYYCDSSGARVDSAYTPDGHVTDLEGRVIR